VETSYKKVIKNFANVQLFAPVPVIIELETKRQTTKGAQMTEFAEWLEKSKVVAEARKTEIWSTENGELVCVDSSCMGNRMYTEVTSSKRKKTTQDGGYLLDAREIEYMRNFLINEIGEKSPTCTCGRVEIKVAEAISVS